MVRVGADEAVVRQTLAAHRRAHRPRIAVLDAGPHAGDGLLSYLLELQDTRGHARTSRREGDADPGVACGTLELVRVNVEARLCGLGPTRSEVVALQRHAGPGRLAAAPVRHVNARGGQRIADGPRLLVQVGPAAVVAQQLEVVGLHEVHR